MFEKLRALEFRSNVPKLTKNIGISPRFHQESPVFVREKPSTQTSSFRSLHKTRPDATAVGNSHHHASKTMHGSSLVPTTGAVMVKWGEICDSVMDGM